MKGAGLSSPQTPPRADADPRPLSSRESEVLALLADGMSGAAIAERLVISPETVRTHVRNAMEKLGAATRSQAVGIALERGDIRSERSTMAEPTAAAGAEDPAARDATLKALLAGLVTLPDVESATIYLVEQDRLSLRTIARVDAAGIRPRPAGDDRDLIHLGEGGIGRVALEGRSELIGGESLGESVIATPMTHAGHLDGVLGVGLRASRPAGRREVLLIEAFGRRVAEILTASGDARADLRLALQRFRVSWAGGSSRAER